MSPAAADLREETSRIDPSTSKPSTGDNSRLPWYSRNAIFVGVVAVALIWWCCLTYLSLTTANPVTLNRTQLVTSEGVVHARLEDLSEGRILIKAILFGKDRQGTIKIRNLEKTKAVENQEFLIPLTTNEEGWLSVTPLSREVFERELYLVYPYSEARKSEVLKLLETAPIAQP